MPDVSEAFFLEAVQALVENERHFVPAAPGCLYVRPVLMGVDAALGVKSSSDFIFYVMTLPSGPYFKDAGEGPGSINVMVTTSTVRSAPGLMGSVKAGANYAGTLKVTEDAKALGCAQVLFLDSRDHKYLEELGGMNVHVRAGQHAPHAAARRHHPERRDAGIARRDRARSRHGDQRSADLDRRGRRRREERHHHRR